ncbi:MAG: DNA translocase FtsK 4TM domain-containing protein, partial [Gammaproteobacteria bacterium]|nr:DNA translocase FtsK 4TM domain-containing protein [Gammaproteobacteria bacterium]
MPQAKRKRAPRTAVAARGQRLVHEVVLYGLLAVGAYLLLALLSYSPSDPGWSHSGPTTTVANLGGRFGAMFADILLQGFGFTAYLFVYLIGVTAWRLYRGNELEPAESRTRILRSAGFLMLLAGASGLENLHFGHFSAAMPFVGGGVAGDLANGLLVASFARTGATLFLLALLLSGITLFGGFSWLQLMDRMGEGAFELADRVRAVWSYLGDRIAGRRARNVRRDSVAEIRQRLRTQRPARIEPKIRKPLRSAREERERQRSLFAPAKGSVLPPLDLLDATEPQPPGFSRDSLDAMAQLVVKKLADFGLEVQVTGIEPGPVITRFEIEPAAGIKASQISGLDRDLARALSVVSVRVVGNIPGKTVIGLEIP